MTTNQKNTELDVAAKSDQQKKAARAPQKPHHVADPSTHKPAETGKPVWDKPHSA